VAANIKAAADMTIKEIVRENRSSSADVYDALRKIGEGS